MSEKLDVLVEGRDKGISSGAHTLSPEIMGGLHRRDAKIGECPGVITAPFIDLTVFLLRTLNC